MLRSMWPDKTLAANLKPSETFLAKYDIISIKTNTGNKPKGQPAGTNKEKNLNPCIFKPNIVLPIIALKLKKKVRIKWDVDAKL